ncbi:hypothetical protein [Sorangium cellulosum]|uniref:hypothetical protein n=1 Tax=Sorangium cellulosum TaxID=56 RepID=UPI001331949A|nr:hypothetical protein [Sorangium cellulosum]
MSHEDPCAAHVEEVRGLAALEREARGDGGGLVEGGAEDGLDLGEGELDVVVAEADDDLAAGREDAAERGKGGLRGAACGAGLRLRDGAGGGYTRNLGVLAIEFVAAWQGR